MNRSYLMLTVAFSLLLASPGYSAEQGTLQVIIPWEAEGRVFQADTRTIMFLGAVKGVMYVESSRGEMHEAFVMCPLIQKLSLETGTTEGTAHCEISASPENIAYAEISCSGAIGSCEGELTLTDGKGKFAGISGAGTVRVRSPMHAIISDMAAGAVVRVSSGLMVIEDLDYRIP